MKPRERNPSIKAVEAGRLIELKGINSIAKSLGAKQVAPMALENAKKYHIIPYLVDDSAAALAAVRFADEYRILVEPACGASLVAVYKQDEILQNYNNIVVVVCGGANVDLDQMHRWRVKYR